MHIFNFVTVLLSICQLAELSKSPPPPPHQPTPPAHPPVHPPPSTHPPRQPLASPHPPPPTAHSPAHPPSPAPTQSSPRPAVSTTVATTTTQETINKAATTEVPFSEEKSSTTLVESIQLIENYLFNANTTHDKENGTSAKDSTKFTTAPTIVVHRSTSTSVSTTVPSTTTEYIPHETSRDLEEAAVSTPSHSISESSAIWTWFFVAVGVLIINFCKLRKADEYDNLILLQ